MKCWHLSCIVLDLDRSARRFSFLCHSAASGTPPFARWYVTHMKFSQNAPLPGTTTQLRERNATACVGSFLLPRCGCWNRYTLLFVKKYKINFFGIPIVKANHENVKRSLWNGQKKNHRKSTFTFVRQQSNCSANFSQYFRSADTLTLVAYFWQHIQLTYSPDNPTTACHTFDHCNSNQFRHRLYFSARVTWETSAQKHQKPRVSGSIKQVC